MARLHLDGVGGQAPAEEVAVGLGADQESFLADELGDWAVGGLGGLLNEFLLVLRKGIGSDGVVEAAGENYKLVVPSHQVNVRDLLRVHVVAAHDSSRQHGLNLETLVSPHSHEYCVRHFLKGA